MDLNQLSELKPELIDVPLIFNAEGEPTDGFKVVDLNSEEYQEADRAWKVQNVRKTARRGHGIEAKTETGAAELVALVAKREMVICLACIKEIYGFTVDGAPAPITESTLKKLFSKRPSWRQRTVMAIEVEQNFTLPSSANGE